MNVDKRLYYHKNNLKAHVKTSTAISERLKANKHTANLEETKILHTSREY